MNELLEAAKAVIDDWNRFDNRTSPKHALALMDAVERSEKQEVEPVAWSSIDGYVYRSYIVAKHSSNGREPLPLYRHPRQPVRLSDLEISGLMNDVTGLGTYKGYKLFAEKIMDAMLEKNQ